jgi:hypothetical protein
MWSWRKMEKFSWTDASTNEEVLHRVKEKRNTLRLVKRRKAIRIGQILRKNSLTKHVIEGKMGEMRRRCKRRTQLLDYLKEERRY